MQTVMSVWCGNSHLFDVDHEKVRVPEDGAFLTHHGTLYRVQQVRVIYSVNLDGMDVSVQVEPFSILNLINFDSHSRKKIGEMMERMGQGDASWLKSAARLKWQIESLRENDSESYENLKKLLMPDLGPKAMPYEVPE